MIELPFIPQEVDKLQDINMAPRDDTVMTNALLIGPTQTRTGLSEKPSLYDTVIQPTSTGVSHPVPQPVSYGVSGHVAEAFAHHEEEVAPTLNQGSYSIPVSLQGGQLNDPTLSGYETPSFIHLGEKQIDASNIHSDAITSDPAVHLKNTMEGDIETFVKQFDNAKDKQETVGILLNGKARLTQESAAITAQVQADIKELLFAKEVAIKLNNLLASYETKLRKEALSKMKLSDEITLKELLRDKLHREMQGFRTSPGEYKDLDLVNPADIAKIISDVKVAINH